MTRTNLMTLAALAKEATEFPARLELFEPIEIQSEWGTSLSCLPTGKYEWLCFGDAEKAETYALLKPLERDDKAPFLHFGSNDLPHWRLERTL